MAFAAPLAAGGAVATADPAPSKPPSVISYASSPGADAAQVVIHGTSTMHDWTVNGNSINGTLMVAGQWQAGSAPHLAAIPAAGIDLTIPVNSLKSTEGSGMDNTMYDSLNLKQFPTITYHLTSADLKSPPSKDDAAYQFSTTGQLVIAGTTRSLNLDLEVLGQDNGQLTVTAKTTLRMTDYGIKPPTAMLGMIKSRDAVNVEVIWQLIPKTPPTTIPSLDKGRP